MSGKTASGWKGGRLIAAAMVCLLGFSGLLLITPHEASGLVLYVGHGSTYDTIGDALDDAVSGDVIVVASGSYNGSFNVSTRSITIRGNATASVLLSAPPGENSEINAPYTIVTGMTFVGQSLTVSSNNVSLGGIAFKLSNGTGIVVESSSFIDITGIGFSGTPGSCLEIANSSNIMVDSLHPSGSESVICTANNVSNLTFKNMVIDLSAGSRGFVASGDSMGFENCTISSAERAIGIHLQGTDLDLQDMRFDMVGTAMHLFGSTIAIGNSIFTITERQSCGIELSSCDNVSINGTAFFLDTGGRGMNVYNVKDMSMDNSSVSMLGNATMFLNGTHLLRAGIADLSYSSRGDNQTGIYLSGGIVSGTFLYGCVDMSISRSSFYQGGNRSTIIALSDHRNLRMMDNIFMTTGMMTNGIVLGPGKSAMLGSNSHSIRSDDSFGVQVGSDSGQVRDSTFIVWGDVSSGLIMSGADNELIDSSFTSFKSGWLLQLGGRTNEVLYSEFFLNGPGMAINVLGDVRSGIIEGCALDLQGAGSTGIGAGPVPLHSYNLLVLTTIISSMPDAGHSIITSHNGMNMILKDLIVWSNSTTPALYLGGREIVLDNVILKSPGLGIEGHASGTLTLNNSRIDAGRALELHEGDYHITGSELISSGPSISANGGSDVMVLDTKLTGIVVDTISTVTISNTIEVEMLYKGAIAMEGVEILIANTRTGVIHSTPYFGGNDPLSGPDGKYPSFIALNSYYEGSNTPRTVITNATVHIEGTATIWDHVEEIDTSSPATVPIVIPDIDLPGIVNNLTAISIEAVESIKLQWDPNADDTILYRIYSFSSGTWSLAAEVDHPSTSWISEELGPSMRGIFRVTAFDGVWEGAPSQPAINVTVDLTPPEMPDPALISKKGIDYLVITWEMDPESDLGGFIIEMNSTPSMTQFEILADLDPTERSYTVQGLAPATLYGFRMLSFDTSYNYSPYTNVFQGRTEPMIFSLEVTVTYRGGPLSGQSAQGAIVRLLSFNGTLVESFLTEEAGKAFFTSLEMGGEYNLEGHPDPGLRGEAGVSTGYLVNNSVFISASGADPFLHSDLFLTYYFKPVTGSIDAFVIFGEGPRSGAVFNAMIELLDPEDIVIENRTTNNLGEATFIIRSLPFTGRFKVTPPDAVAAIPGKKAGYVQKMTNTFEVSSEDPDWGRFEIRLEYLDFEPPPRELLVLWKTPVGVVRDLDTPIRVMFNQPMNTLSVESYTRIEPPIKGTVFFWSNNNQSLSIEHDGLGDDVTYTITIGFEVRSGDGTGFPEDYSNNTWTFRTDKPIGGVNGIPKETLYIAIAIFAIIVIAIGIYIYIKQPRDDDLEGDEEEFDPYNYDYLDEEAYDDLDEGYEDELVDDEAPIGSEEVPIEDDETEDEAEVELQEEDVITDEEANEETAETAHEITDEAPSEPPIQKKDEMEKPPTRVKKVARRK